MFFGLCGIELIGTYNSVNGSLLAALLSSTDARRTGPTGGLDGKAKVKREQDSLLRSGDWTAGNGGSIAFRLALLSTMTAKTQALVVPYIKWFIGQFKDRNAISFSTLRNALLLAKSVVPQLFIGLPFFVNDNR